MTGVQAWWQGAGAVEAAVTTLCAALTAGHFLHVCLRSAGPGRKGAALTLVIVAVGNAAQAGVTFAGRDQPAVALAGLPMSLGQLLVAWHVLKQMERQ